MSRSVVVALSGPSGAGKSTTVARVAEATGWVALDEAFYRLRPRPPLRFRSDRELAAIELRLLGEEARRFGEARRLSDDGVSVVADTGFLDPVDYTAGLVLLGRAQLATARAVLARARALATSGRLGIADLTVHLSVSPRARSERVRSDPRGHPRAFRERHELVGTLLARTVRPAVARQLPGRVVVVRAGASPAAVARRIVRRALRTRPLGDRSAAAGRWLAVLERLVDSRSGQS